MTLVFQEDGLVSVAADEADVLRQCEGIDVLSSVYQFYDDRGNALTPVFDVPVREGRLFWFIRTVESGRYHLEAAAESHQRRLSRVVWGRWFHAIRDGPFGRAV